MSSADSSKETRFLHYALAQKLGEGKNGVSWQALDTGLGRVVVVKLFHSNIHFTDEQRQQALAANERLGRGKIEEQTFVRYLDWDLSEGQQYLVREFVTGRTIEELTAKAPLRATDFLNWAIQLARAVEIAHALNILLENITPRNVIVNDQGALSITDHGPLGTSSARLRPLDLSCRAPELLAGQSATPSSDLYALGAVFYQMLIGEPPFLSETLDAQRQAIFTSPPLFPQERSGRLPELRLVIQKLLTKDPAERFNKAHELCATLEEIKKHFSEDAVVVQEDAPSGRSARFYLTLSMLVLALVILWFVLAIVTR